MVGEKRGREEREGGRGQRSPLSVITLLFSAATPKRKSAGKSAIAQFPQILMLLGMHLLTQQILLLHLWEMPARM